MPATAPWKCGRSWKKPGRKCEKGRPTEGLLRELAPQVLGVLVRRYRQFDARGRSAGGYGQ